MRRELPPRFASNAFDRIASSRLIEESSIGLTRRFLRILAYHGVDDPESLDAQMAYVRANYAPVSVDDVLESLDGRPLPAKAVWVTFDDGHPSLVEQGLPIIQKWEIPVTLLVCPGVIDTTAPFWWQAIERSFAAGDDLALDGTKYAGSAGAAALIKRLKVVPDTDRRQVIASLSDRGRVSRNLQYPQLTTSQLRRVAEAGGSIGNHTWDHPCLDNCDPAQQREQIVRAHEYLRSLGSVTRPVIAYPNGNWTRVAADVATELGYRIGLLFDHRLTDRAQAPTSWSRLRVNSDTSLSRFRSILSGVHSGLTRLRRLSDRKSHVPYLGRNNAR